jgi:hypothetical protein
MSSTSIDLRCNRDSRRLFAKFKTGGEPLPITEDNLIEVTCRDCAKAARYKASDVKQVFHRFDLLGRLVETEWVDLDGEQVFVETFDPTDG